MHAGDDLFARDAVRQIEQHVFSDHVSSLGECCRRLAFGRCGDIDHWITHLERSTATLERWKVGKTGSMPPHALALVHGRDKRVWMVDTETKPKTGDTLYLLVPTETAEVTRGWMVERGWVRREDGLPTAEHLRPEELTA